MRFLPPLLPFLGLAAATTTKIMPLGDSITGGPGCWCALLWNQLQAAGYNTLDFVGTLPVQGCGIPYDGDNEGHSGYLVTNIANQNLLPGWLAATDPDVVLMHFGTNDVWNGIASEVILDAYSTLLRQMREQKEGVKLLVAQILPMEPSGCGECAERVRRLNAEIPAWVERESKIGSEVYVVDQWTGFDMAIDAYDGIHPNENGNVKIADRWFEGLEDVL